MARARLATIHDLPDGVLGRVLHALVSPEPGAPRHALRRFSRLHHALCTQDIVALQALSTAMLVCKRWRQVAYSTPALWAEFTLRANEVAGGHNAPFALEPLARAAAFLRATHDLLRRVGRHVAAFTAWECSRLPATPAGSAGGWRLAQFLRLLEPATLSALTIDEARWLLNQAPLDPEALELLPRFTHLTALCLMSSSRLQLPPSVPDILQRLPRLVRLRLGFAPPDEATGSAGSLCAAAAWAIGMLTALEWLEVPFMFDTFPKPLPWGGLTRLQHLILVGNLPAGGLRMFPMLSSYDVKFCTAANLEEPMVFAQFLDGTLRLDRTHAVMRVWGEGVHRPRSRTDVGALLPLLPAGQPVKRVEMHNCHLPAALAGGQAPDLTSLHLCSCFTRGDDEVEGVTEVSEAAMQALLHQAPALCNLSIEDSLGGAVPACIVALTSLTRLSLRSNELTSLPPGPYLEGCLDLDLGGNSFERLPPALAAATALTRLALDDNDELALSPADARLLAALPRLELLELGPASLVPQRVQAQLAAAEHLRISYGWGDTSSQGTSSGSSSDDEGMGSGSDEER